MPKNELFDQQEVLKKALVLFWEKGFHGTSIAELEQVMAINRSSIYNTYGDKYTLFVKALRLYQSHQAPDVTTRFAQAVSPLAAIRSLFEYLALEATDNRQNGCFMVNTTTELANQNPALNKLATEAKEAYLHLFTGLIEQAQAAGEVAAQTDARGLALYLFSAQQGLRVTGMLAKSDEELRQIVAHTLSVLQ